jgi:hypothetical protein
MEGEFYFNPLPSAAPPSSSTSVTPDNTSGTTAASLEVTFWNSIKDAKNPLLFEAYLRRYPNGAFVDIAKINLEQFKVALAKPTTGSSDERLPITDPGLLREIRDRLYELNFDPLSAKPDGLKAAIREFEAQSKIAQTGEATQGLLRRLREIGGLTPWGAIVYDKTGQRWGMAWDQPSRREAVASARAQCKSTRCSEELSFFGTACGAFALSSARSWSLASRVDIQSARESALDDCGKHGKSCRIIGASCADGANRTAPNN